jgi:DNA-binding LytR/AlgR family response regulator
VELLGMQRPEVVVIDLALGARAGYAVVARLAACEPAPVAALVAGDDDAPAAFAAALAEQAPADRMLPLADLLVRVLGQT